MPRTANTKSTEFSRERNRIHAQRTRQRKKEQSTSVQALADELKKEQLRLKQVITEKVTANILLGLFAKNSGADADGSDDPRIDEILRRPAEDIPNVSQMTELLPPLILPGQHASKKMKEAAPLDGFDHDLLGKDRSKCSSKELDLIRRERNRMHAKRTRERKRLFMGSMTEICRALEEENDLLRTHLRSIDPEHEACTRAPTMTTATTLIATSTKSTKTKLMLTSFSEDHTVTASETSTPALSPHLLPISPSFSCTADQLDLNATTAASSCKASQLDMRLGEISVSDIFSSLLEAAMLEEVSKKRVYPSVSSDDSNDDDDATRPRGIANKRNRMVEL
ncbi:hypothetical protein MPSEU_000647600 [Mayamaea pseudoterrestris]|nr:hypothetical protein MPSEU_000647600 [Mayamaea pseudoterrestris]